MIWNGPRSDSHSLAVTHLELSHLGYRRTHCEPLTPGRPDPPQ